MRNFMVLFDEIQLTCSTRNSDSITVVRQLSVTTVELREPFDSSKWRMAISVNPFSSDRSCVIRIGPVCLVLEGQ